jgi:hypothetical protein
MKVILKDFTEESVMASCAKVMRCLAISDKEKIDELMHIDAQLYQNTGTETPKYIKEKLKSMSRNIYRLVRHIDEQKGSRFLRAMIKD